MRFYACPRLHAILDYPFVGFVLGSFLRGRPGSLQALLPKLKDEIRYLSLGDLEPDLIQDADRDIQLFSGGSSDGREPIMTASVLQSFQHAVLLRQHLVDRISCEMQDYESARSDVLVIGRDWSDVSL